MASDNAIYRMPWERRSEEPTCDYSRLQAYLSLGPRRSLAQAAEHCGLSLARLKQLSARWGWPARALAWDREQSLARRRRELEAARQMRRRLLDESADWQRIARLEFGRWVCQDAEGRLRLVRPLTAHQAIRLWQVGCQAEMELREAIAPGPEPPREWHTRRVAEKLQEAAREAAGDITGQGAHPDFRSELDQALRRVLAAWAMHYADPPREPTPIDITATLWPWDLPFAEA